MTSDSTESVKPPETGTGRRKRLRLRLSMFPTMLTLGNLVCGVLALAYIADASGAFRAGRVPDAQHLVKAAGVMILLGMVFDALDGRVARLTRSTTEFGGALDSLADVVSFGVAPALLAKTLVEQELGSFAPKVAFVTAAFYAVCATLRLARYNAEHEEPDQAVRHFVGLPTPGAAGVLASLAICHANLLEQFQPDAAARTIVADVLRFGVLVGLGLLMVSRVPYLHFANRFLAGRRPIGFIALVVLFVALALHFPWEYLVGGVFVLYAVSGPIAVIPRLIRGRKEEVVPELFE